MMERTFWSLLLFLVSAVLINNLVGCGAAEQRTAHTALNAITDIADPTYQLAVDSCDAARDVIIERGGTTYAEDRAAMDQIHAVCDPMIIGFESLRSVQITARAAIDSGLPGAAAAAIQEALALWNTLRALVPQIEQLGTNNGGGQ